MARRYVAVAALWALALGVGLGCRAPADPPPLEPTGEAYLAEVEAWHARRTEGLRRDEGWLSLVGLFWLEPGANAVGSDPDGRIVLPAGKAPARVGTIHLESDGAARIEADPSSGLTHEGEPVAELALASDADGEATRLELGDLLFHLIRRGDRLGVRVKDRSRPAASGFDGVDHYPVDESWRLAATFEPYDPPEKIPIVNVLGMVSHETSWGAVRFEVAGTSYRLDALAEPGDPELFLIFADQTSGRTTYGGGRYLYAAAPDADGRVVVDFNRAYNPPCVFTEFATCPLPPRQNRLPFAVEAGEKNWGEH